MRSTFIVVCMTVFGLSSTAFAWWPETHGRLSEQAALSLPKEMPAFFRQGGKAIAHYSYDADIQKHRQTPLLKEMVAHEHFLDWEELEGKSLPENYEDYIRMVFKMGFPDLYTVGTLPYALVNWSERLTLAFAEYRKWPKNPRIQQKIFVYAGMIAHFAQDGCQPLHLTMHFDGKKKLHEKSPRTGIHEKTDGVIERIKLSPSKAKLRVFQDLFSSVLTEFQKSHDLYPTVYELEATLPPTDGPWTADKNVVSFANERAEASIRFTAELFFTAWKKSADIELPKWLKSLP